MSHVVRTFSTRPGQRGPILAAKAWQVLVIHATTGRPLTYERLAELVGMKQTANTITNNAIIYVTAYCELNDLPGLNTIVCNKDTGEPGGGAPQSVSMFKVFEFPWFDICPPSPKSLREARQALYGAEGSDDDRGE